MNDLRRLIKYLLPKSFHIRRLFLILIFVISNASILSSAELSVKKVAVLVSLNIRPYLEAVEGFEDRFSRQNEAAIDVFNLEDYTGKRRDTLIKDLSDGNYDLCISVGPEASRLMRSDKLSGKILKIFTMLLNPNKIFNSNESICGISLDIPGKLIMQTLSRTFPSVKRIGLLYDPKNNFEFARQAVGDSAIMDMKIIPLEVSSRKDIPIVLQENWGKIDGLWLIPDRTVSVESLVRHVIKEAISNGVAVFGYNRFFYESGAAWCYVLDYKEIGRQTAELSLAMLSGRHCKQQIPEFKAWYNPRVLNRLGIDLVVDPAASVKIEPGP